MKWVVKLIMVSFLIILFSGAVYAPSTGGSGSASGACFLPSQVINLADSTYKKIKDIKMGDLVKVYNEKTHQVENAPVKKIQTIYHDNVHELHLSNGKLLKPTANHPFLTKEKGWATISGLDELNMGAAKLEIGDHLYSLNSKGILEEVEVLDIVPVKGNYLTYNFIDMKYGTFLADDVVVHNSGDPSPHSLKFSLMKNNKWNQIDQDFHTHVIRSGEYRQIPVNDYLDEDGYLTLKIEWTDRHIVDKVGVVNAVEKPFKKESLKILSAKHSRDGDVTNNLLKKDYEYGHTVRGDTINLEFDSGNLKHNNNEEVDYFFVSRGFYHGLRTYLYPGVDTSNSYIQEINKYICELNDYLKK